MGKFSFQKATKKQAKLRLGISGPAGAGKTYSALNLAQYLGDKVAVIDTEHGSASKYANEFNFDVLELDDFHPNNYVEAIKAAEEAGYDVCVIDSVSHEWSGANGCLELVEQFGRTKWKGNKYAAWADVTPLHNKFIEAITGSKMHIIGTMRSKMDYIQTEDNGKKTIQKVGMAPITREGAEYEFDIVGEMNLEHMMMITKSRAKDLADTVWTKPDRELAEAIKAWLSDGEEAPEQIDSFAKAMEEAGIDVFAAVEYLGTFKYPLETMKQKAMANVGKFKAQLEQWQAAQEVAAGEEDAQ